MIPNYIVKVDARLVLIGVMLLQMTCEAVELNEEKEAKLQLFVGSQGNTPELIEGFKNEAIQALVAKLDSGDISLGRARVREAILQYLMRHSNEIEPSIVTDARRAVYGGLSASEATERWWTVGTVARLEGEKGLNLLRPLLNDPAEEVRLAVISQYAAHGTMERIAELEAMVDERTSGKHPDAIRQDKSVVFAREAIKGLKKRWNVGPALPPEVVTPLPSSRAYSENRGDRENQLLVGATSAKAPDNARLPAEPSRSPSSTRNATMIGVVSGLMFAVIAVCVWRLFLRRRVWHLKK